MNCNAQSQEKSIRCIVRGRVQGVGFRAWTARQAKKLDLTGTVRNVSDGSVEVFACGPEKKLEAFVQDLHAGPAAAAVESVETQIAEFQQRDNFAILHPR